MALDSFLPELWASMILNSLKEKSVGEFFVNHNYEGMITSGGTSVNINIMNDIVTKKYTPGSEITYDDLGTTSAKLLIDQSDYCAIKLDDVKKVQAAGDLLNAATSNMGYSLDNKYDKYIFDTLKAAATAKPTNMVGTDEAPINIAGTNANTSIDTIIDIITIAAKNNIPDANRVAAVGPGVAGVIMKSDKRSITPKFAEFIRTGYIGNLFGVEIFRTNNLAQSTSGNDFILVTTPEMTTVANQILNVEAIRSEKMFADLVRALHVYGAKVIYDTGVVGAYVKTSAEE